jgi:hypothetical protein
MVIPTPRPRASITVIPETCQARQTCSRNVFTETTRQMTRLNDPKIEDCVYPSSGDPFVSCRRVLVYRYRRVCDHLWHRHRQESSLAAGSWLQLISSKKDGTGRGCASIPRLCKPIWSSIKRKRKHKREQGQSKAEWERTKGEDRLYFT